MISNEMKETPVDNLIDPTQNYDDMLDPKAMVRGDKDSNNPYEAT